MRGSCMNQILLSLAVFTLLFVTSQGYNWSHFNPKATTPGTATTPLEIDCDAIPTHNRALDCTGLADGLYPNLANCSMYIYCSNGNSYDCVCPYPLWFNPEISICDWEFNVDCIPVSTTMATTTTTTTTTTTPTTTTEDPTFYCPDETCGIYADTIECEAYHFCLDGKDYAYRCPHGQLFDTVTFLCKHPNEAVCDINTWSPLLRSNN